MRTQRKNEYKNGFTKVSEFWRIFFYVHLGNINGWGHEDANLRANPEELKFKDLEN